MASGKHDDTAALAFDDDHITVGLLGFDPSTRICKLRILEKHEGVGLYQITVDFASGNSAQIQYDGAIKDQDAVHTATTSLPNDSVKKIIVKRAR